MSLIRGEKIEFSTQLGLIATRSAKHKIMAYLLKAIVLF